MPCGCHAPAGPPSWYRNRRKVPNPILTNPDRSAHSTNGHGNGPGAMCQGERKNDLLRRANHRHEAHLFPLIRHRDQLLPRSSPFDVASHAEESPADLAERLVAIPSDRILASAARAWAGPCLGRVDHPRRARSAEWSRDHSRSSGRWRTGATCATVPAAPGA